MNIWNITDQFEGNYIEDYHMLMHKETSWRDKYTCSIFTCPSLGLKQPLPDYPRWVETQELHYLPLEERHQLEYGVWDHLPGLFVPSTILDLCVKVCHNPPEDIQVLIGLLAWLPLQEVRDYYEKATKHELDTLTNDELREVWKTHHSMHRIKQTWNNNAVNSGSL